MQSAWNKQRDCGRFPLWGLGAKKDEDRVFWCFAYAEMERKSKLSPFFYSLHFSRCNSLLPNPTETLATQAKFLLGISFKKSAFHLSQSSIQGRPGRLKDRERYGTGDKDEKSVNGPTGLPFQEFCLCRKISSGKSCFIYIPTGISGIVW